MAKPKVLLVGGPDVDARLDLMRLLSKRFEVAAAGSEPALESRFTAAGFRFRAFPMTRRASPLADLGTFRALVRLLREERPDVVHAFDTKPTVWARLAARRAGVPVVVGTIPGLGSLFASGAARALAARILYEPLQALACRAADLTIFQNEDDRREFEARSIVPRGKSAIVPGSGVRTDLFRPDVPTERRDALRREWGVAGDDIVVTMVARLARPKGVLEFAAAARGAAARATGGKLPRIRFVLVGPEDTGGVDRLARHELDEVRAAVTWLGARTDVKEILAASDVFALPSYYREGFPRALVEAAAMALPLVAADVPGSREVVRHRENGYLVPPRDVPALTDALAALASDAGLRRSFGAASRRLAESAFDLGRIAELTGALYLSLLDPHSGGRA